ncbi:MAG: 50S ribosomal protein L11 methyltransferase [Rhodobacteraceae bacterium]|nr:50S ribosomal protein L11 methyltransferase [Paracoccaceae bacterium]MBR9819888.1 50S ribosomal protein L11 methyltransferase [Paracoccaceae bacterium]
MATWTALTTLTSKADAEALGTAMENLVPEATGIGVFEVEDDSGLWEVGGYFEEKPDIAGLELLAKINGAKPFAVSELPETDWVAHVKRELAPVEAGRFFVYGSHDADKVPTEPAKIPLLIEAAMAFGTGHHGTTLGCLRALDRLDTEGFSTDRTADIGCGTAVLAMAAARIWPGTPVAGDIDPVAVEVAEANMRANGMAGRVTCVEAAGFGNPALEAGAPYGLVFANILMGPLISLAPDIAGHLEAGGYAILSGLLNEQAPAVQEAYEAEGFALHHAEQIREWTTLTLRKV